MAKKSASRVPSDEQTIINTLREYRREAEEARRDRLAKNRQNWDTYFGHQDWSHKQAGQSTEHLPKLSAAAEQMSAFVKRALVQFGDWFSLEMPRGSPMTAEQARKLLRLFLENLALNRFDKGNFATIMSDGVKQGLMEALIILKVHGQYMTERSYAVEPGSLVAGLPPQMTDQENEVWRLRIDLISMQDYYPDPTGRRLYEIHRVERDLFDVIKSAEEGMYDMKEVEKLSDDFESKDREAYRLQPRHRGAAESTPPRFRRRVTLDEMWGVILGPDGRPIHENVVATLANDRFLVRQPTKNPFWHNESPIVVSPVIRVPHSVHHKALYDDAAGLNNALNELFNLILDGGISSVWGVRQVRPDWLKDERQISNGIAPGDTLLVNENAPSDGKVVETVSTGKVPPEAMAVLNLTDREFQASAKTNDSRLGFLPPRAVKATEVVQAEQSASAVLDAFAADLETELISKVLKKSWLTILQFMDDVPTEDVVQAVGPRMAFMLSRMSPAERYSLLGQCFGFSASGLSATLARARDFQKLMAMMQGVGTNPILMEAFVRRFNSDKVLDFIMKSLNLNPESLQLTPEEQAQVPQRVGNMAALQGAGLVGPGGAGGSRTGGGDAQSESRSEVNQLAEPTSGMLGG